VTPGDIYASRAVKDADKRLLALNQARKERDVERLIFFLRDADHRDFAASTLGKLGDPRGIGPLRPLLAASDFRARAAAAHALADLGDADSVDRLKEMALDDPHEVPRMWAVVGVGKLAGRDALAFLISCLDDPHPKVRQNAAYALGLVGDPHAVEPIRQAKQKDSWRWRKIYAKALERIRTASAP